VPLSLQDQPPSKAFRLRAGLRKALDRTPLTMRGLLVAGLSGASLWAYGFGRLDLLLFVIGMSGLALVVVAAAVTGTSALHVARVARERRAEIGALECGSRLRTGFRLPAFQRVPLVQLHWTWERPLHVEVHPRLLGHSLWEEVIGRQRALEERLVRSIVVQDAFGLSRVRWRNEEAIELMLLPEVGGLRRSTLLPSLSGADGMPDPTGLPEGDRMEIRRYVPGDSARHIMWSWYAKTRQLVVRMPERSLDRSRRVVAYLVCGDGDEPAAAVARVALEQNALGTSWRFGADGTPGSCDSLEPALRAICRSGSRSGVELRCGLREFLRDPAVSGDTHCVVFAPARSGAWLQTALEILRERRGALSFVIATDGIARRRQRPRWQRLLLLDEAQRGSPADQLAMLSAQLVRAGARVLIADRPSGRYYEESRAHALEAIA
jgi:hypothetical protein